MIDQLIVEEFLTHNRLAVVGASADPRKFGNTVYKAFREHGYDVVGVNPSTAAIDGDTCYPDLAAVPGELDGVVVMVGNDAAAEVVRACVARGIRRVWLFKGIGGSGAASDEAMQLCVDNGIAVVAGACPLMFLGPVRGVHRFHRAMRRMNHSLAAAS